MSLRVKAYYKGFTNDQGILSQLAGNLQCWREIFNRKITSFARIGNPWQEFIFLYLVGYIHHLEIYTFL
jgi:hypothetical protein